MEKIGTRPKTIPEPDDADFATTRTGALYTNVPHWGQIVTTAEKRDTKRTNGETNYRRRSE